MTHDFLLIGAMILGPAGAAWVGVKVALNGLRAAVDKTGNEVVELRKGQERNGNRLTAIETRLGGQVLS